MVFRTMVRGILFGFLLVIVEVIFLLWFVVLTAAEAILGVRESLLGMSCH
jgi:hypothetical protein